MTKNEIRIVIGGSDMSRDEMDKGGYTWGESPQSFLSTIDTYERLGYEVKFETSIWRKIFCLCKYQVVAYKKNNPNESR